MATNAEAFWARGERSGRRRKVNDAQRTEIIRAYQQGEHPRTIAPRYGIARSTVRMLVRGSRKAQHTPTNNAGAYPPPFGRKRRPRRRDRCQCPRCNPGIVGPQLEF